MTKESNELMFNFAQNVLLNVYFKASDSKKYIPLKKRNKIIRDYCDLNINKEENKLIKSQIKRIIVHAKKGINVELKISEIVNQHLANKNKLKLNDCDKLYKLLSFLELKHGIPSRLVGESDKCEFNTVYILPEQVELGFDDNGIQITPIYISIDMNNAKLDLKEEVEKTGLFNLELDSKKESKSSTLYLYKLHPTRLKSTKTYLKH